MKNWLLLLALTYFAHNCFSQDSLSANTPKLPKGIYLTVQQYFKREPAIYLPFRIVPNYCLVSNKKSGLTDTVALGFDFIFFDTSISKPTQIFCFSDGEEMYMFCETGFYKTEHAGKYPFVTATTFEEPVSVFALMLGGLNPAALIASSVVTIVENTVPRTKIKRKIFFYNKKSQLVLANNQSIQWLLKDDKDLSKAFFNLRNHDLSTYQEFLVRMNDRYH